MRLLMLSMVSLSLAFGASTARAGDCQTLLVGNEYACRAVTEGGEQFALSLHFQPSLSSSKFALRIDGGDPVECSCKAEKINLTKPDAIKFDKARSFHCGPELSGAELSGPESFSVDEASYEGVAKRNGIHHGEAFDKLGRAVAYDCEGSRLVTGDTQITSGAKVSTFARLAADGSVLEAGATVPFALVASPPAEEGPGPAGALVTLAFPPQVQSTTYFNHFELQWEPDGHPPPFTMVPHFDLHFYSIPPKEVLKVAAPDPQAPAADHLPPDYVYPGVNAVVPEMGVHARNPNEYQGVFTHVFIAGFFNGEMTFLEPALNETFLLQKVSYTQAVPQPAVLGHATRYPTTFTTTFDAAADAYTFVFSDFVPVQ